MINPMSSPASPYEPLKLISFNPNQLINPLISPQCQALSSQLHSTASHPEEYEPIVL